LKLIVEQLAAEPFAPFGEVLTIPEPTGRAYFDRALSNLRPSAHPSLSLSRKQNLSSLPLVARQMERHEFSSQSFVPIEAGRWLIVVAPHARVAGLTCTARAHSSPALARVSPMVPTCGITR
jgi:ureidoglycolate lyase